MKPATDNLPDVLAYHAATLGDRLACVYVPPGDAASQTLSYRALHRTSNWLAAVLQARGLRGRHALLLYPPGLAFVEAFFSCMRGSITAIPMYVPACDEPDARLRAIAETLEIAAILTVQAKEPLARSLAASLYPGRNCPIVCTDTLPVGMGTDAPLIDRSVPPLIQFTSGSVSRPKGVVVSHANLMANQRMIQRGFSHRGGETVVSWLPFFHDMGLIGGILQPLYVGGSAVLMSPADFLQNPHKWLQLISTHAADTSGAPNFAYDHCVAHISEAQAEGLNLSRWSVAFNGSEMIRPATMRRFCERFQPQGFHPKAVVHCYGLAEATLYVSSGRSFPHGLPPTGTPPDAVASVGRPDADAEIRIVGDDGIELPAGRIGEIWVRGLHVARGYLHDLEATRASFHARPLGDPQTADWLRTGDLGYLRRGELYVVGRAKNLMVVRGRKYHGEEIEHFVARSDAHAFLESGACIVQVDEGLADSRIVFMQEVRKTAFDSAGADLPRLEDKARQLSRLILERFDLPVHRFIYLRENRLPRTSSGKVDRRRALDLARAEARCSLLEVQTR